MLITQTGRRHNEKTLVSATRVAARLASVVASDWLILSRCMNESNESSESVSGPRDLV